MAQELAIHLGVGLRDRDRCGATATWPLTTTQHSAHCFTTLMALEVDLVELGLAITHALTIVKGLRAVSEKLKSADHRNAVGDLALAIADIKDRAAELQEENNHLRGLVDAMREREELRGKLTMRDDAYWLTEPPPGRAEGPYCTRCFDVDDKLVLKTKNSHEFLVFGTHRCTNCQGRITSR